MGRKIEQVFTELMRSAFVELHLNSNLVPSLSNIQAAGKISGGSETLAKLLSSAEFSFSKRGELKTKFGFDESESTGVCNQLL